MGQHLCQDENTFGSAMERYQTEKNLVKDSIDGRQNSAGKRQSAKERQSQFKNKSVTFGDDANGTSASAIMFKQSSQSFGASPTIVSQSSPKSKIMSSAQMTVMP